MSLNDNHSLRCYNFHTQKLILQVDTDTLALVVSIIVIRTKKSAYFLGAGRLSKSLRNTCSVLCWEARVQTSSNKFFNSVVVQQLFTPNTPFKVSEYLWRNVANSAFAGHVRNRSRQPVDGQDVSQSSDGQPWFNFLEEGSNCATIHTNPEVLDFWCDCWHRYRPQRAELEHPSRRGTTGIIFLTKRFSGVGTFFFNCYSWVDVCRVKLWFGRLKQLN